MSLLKYEKIILVGIVVVSSIVIGLSFYNKKSNSNDIIAKGAPNPDTNPAPNPTPAPALFTCDSCYYAESLPNLNNICDNQNNDLDVKCTKFFLKNGDPSTQHEMCAELSMIQDDTGCQHCYHDLYQSDLSSKSSICAQYVPGNTPEPQEGTQADYNKAACAYKHDNKNGNPLDPDYTAACQNQCEESGAPWFQNLQPLHTPCMNACHNLGACGRL